jgi:hypothetical protein
VVVPFPSLLEGREDDIIKVFGGKIRGSGEWELKRGGNGFIIVSYAIRLYLRVELRAGTSCVALGSKE